MPLPHLTVLTRPKPARNHKFLALALLLTTVLLEPSQAQTIPRIRLGARTDTTNHWTRLTSTNATEAVHTLQASTDFTGWTNIAVLHDGPFDFADLGAFGLGQRFYRVTSRAKNANDDGKNQVFFPEEAFQSGFDGGLETVRWVKFAILLDDPTRVWFQDSSKYPFHYDFAVKRLTPFAGMSRPQFDAATLRLVGQKAVLGAVLFPPNQSAPEYGVQFVGLDAYPAEQVVQWLKLVAAAVYPTRPGRPIYLPTTEQIPASEADRAVFERAGVTLGKVERWLRGSVCYSSGWALGRLVFVPADQINAAYADGRLKHTDILLTDGIPAEVPYLAGIISLAAATPNSHVAILAQSYRIPFIYLADAAEQAWIKARAGKDILLRAEQAFVGGEIRIAPVDLSNDPGTRAGILALKAPGPVKLTPKALAGVLATNVDKLTPADTRYVGGKAANYGNLRRQVPNNSEPAIAFTFDLWDAFMDQTLPGSAKTLRQEIRDRTATFTYPPSIPAVQQTLAGIRDLITKTARFSTAQQLVILQHLGMFEPGRKIRFRSSTNVEDSEQFTGAGLYDSYSGCAADDLDGDNKGPSICDATEKDERGVFRALQKVYASFYNHNAWLERLRVGMNEDQVGMAVLAHYSFPDADEMANGVAKIRYTKSGQSFSHGGDLVTQLGAVSVTNPEGGAIAEVVNTFGFESSVFFNTTTRSSLVPLGGNVMTWEADYKELARLLSLSANGYAKLFPAKTEFTLDVEYKKMRPGKMVLKQLREVYEPVAQRPAVRYLVNEPLEYVVLQGEQGDVLANHRLKSVLRLETRNLALVASNLVTSFYTNATAELRAGNEVLRLTNGPASWPGAAHSVNGQTVMDRWALGAGADLRTFTLETSLDIQSIFANQPIVTQRDLRKTLKVQYATAVPTLTFEGPGTTKEDTVMLVEREPVTAASLLQKRSLAKGAVAVETEFYWPEPPRGPTAGYTAPVIQWVQTRITGLTSTPLILTNDYAQTYHPGHHNFWEDFAFEPQLDPAVSAAQLEELRVKNIQLIVISKSDSATTIRALGFDGKFRSLP